MTGATHTPWWVWTLESPDPESTGAAACERGVSGVEIISPQRLRAFAAGEPSELPRFEAMFTELGATVVSCEPVPFKNWVQEAESGWAALTIGQLEIVPILDSGGEPTSHGGSPLFITPGSGFGTGHHPTTHMVLTLLQHAAVSQLPVHGPVLDLGTGSGILAIGASILYGAPVDAIEIDPLALENAQVNCVLNGEAGRRVNLLEGDLSAARGPYPLVLANIYAEVLCELEAGFRRIVAPGGKLIVSGIMTSLKELVSTTYADWPIIEAREERGWVAFLFDHPGASPKGD